MGVARGLASWLEPGGGYFLLVAVIKGPGRKRSRNGYVQLHSRADGY